MARFDLSDEEWAAIGPLLPPKGRGPARKDDRTILNGGFYILRTAAPCGEWRERGELHQGVGRSRSSKVHAALDAFERPLRIDATGGQTHDGKAFETFSELAKAATHNPNLCAMGNLVELFFRWMKDIRRPTTRYEKLKRNFLLMLHIFAIRCWLN